VGRDLLRLGLVVAATGGLRPGSPEGSRDEARRDAERLLRDERIWSGGGGRGGEAAHGARGIRERRESSSRLDPVRRLARGCDGRRRWRDVVGGIRDAARLDPAVGTRARRLGTGRHPPVGAGGRSSGVSRSDPGRIVQACKAVYTGSIPVGALHETTPAATWPRGHRARFGGAGWGAPPRFLRHRPATISSSPSCSTACQAAPKLPASWPFISPGCLSPRKR
jgi:hypothetical protein